MRLFPREKLFLEVAAPWGRVVERVRGRARAWPAGFQMRRFGEIVYFGGPRKFKVRMCPGYFAPVMRLTVLRESEPALVRVEIGLSALWGAVTGGVALFLLANGVVGGSPGFFVGAAGAVVAGYVACLIRFRMEKQSYRKWFEEILDGIGVWDTADPAENQGSDSRSDTALEN